MDMIQSAFDRFNRILFGGANCYSLIFIMEKNGAILVAPGAKFEEKFSQKRKKVRIQEKWRLF